MRLPLSGATRTLPTALRVPTAASVLLPVVLQASPAGFCAAPASRMGRRCISTGVCGALRPTAIRLRPSADGDDDDFHFDAAASLAQDATVHRQSQSVDELVMRLLPGSPPREAVDILVKQFRANPINECIQAPNVIITHVENEEGTDTKMKMPRMPLAEALAQARENEMDLVQQATKDGVAYCRLRRETRRALAKVAPLLESAAGAGIGARAGGSAGGAQQGGAEGQKLKLRDTQVHTFRDVADAHFVGWRSRKIVQDLSRRHPVKLRIEKFVAPATAVNKMREMMRAIEAAAAAPVVAHHYSSVVASEKELAVVLTPATKTGTAPEVKHPTGKDWERTLERLSAACGGTGKGTYVAHRAAGQRNLSNQHRVDRFGRRLD